MKQHDDVYHASTMAGEAVLLHPRSQLQQGRFTDALSAFHSVGEKLLNDHILFDVLPDDMATPEKLARYKRVFTISSLPELGAENYADLSRFAAPASVRVSASYPEKRGTWDIHFVNYNRKEPGEKEKTGLIADENLIPVSGIKADLVSPPGFSVDKVEWMTPESAGVKELSVERSGDRVRFTAPEFLVYAVARVHLSAGSSRSDGKRTAGFTGATSRTAPSLAGREALPTSDSEAGCDPTACGHVAPGTPGRMASSMAENYAEDIHAARMPERGRSAGSVAIFRHRD
ncbi:MAG TPA: hypothetical protein VFA33_21185 [Bryobacteraceae bacterium]|nr:hypothetical protein [Bryobacteraceae bacterium]